MFALVTEEMFYLKVDEETLLDYKALGFSLFVYEKKGKMDPRLRIWGMTEGWLSRQIQAS
jgi:TfoX/Sxy family transcriptional regulator of competence genes